MSYQDPLEIDRRNRKVAALESDRDSLERQVLAMQARITKLLAERNAALLKVNGLEEIRNAQRTIISEMQAQRSELIRAATYLREERDRLLDTRGVVA
jgi:hypothetical protein